MNQPVRPLSRSILTVLVPSGRAVFMRAVFMSEQYSRLPLDDRERQETEVYTPLGTFGDTMFSS